MTPTLPPSQLERFLGLTLRTLGFEGARIVVEGRAVAESGFFAEKLPLAELGLFNAQYVEQGLLEVYGSVGHQGTILGQAEGQTPTAHQTLTAHQWRCLEDFASLASELLALESPQSLEQVYIDAPMAMLILDAQGRVEGCNGAAERLWDYGALEMRGKSVDDIVTATRGGMQALVSAVQAGQTVRDFACSSLTKQGAVLQLNLSITPVSDGSGLTLRFMCCVDEVSQRLRLSQRLEEQKQFYETILDHIPAEIAVLDKDLRYLYINPKAVKNPELRAWSIGKRDAEIVARAGWSVEASPERRAKLEQVVSEGEQQTWEESFDFPSGRVFRQRNANPVFDASGELRFIVGYSFDITALKHRKEEQRRALEEYKTLFENARVGLYRADAQGKLLAVNPTLVRMSGHVDEAAFLHAFNLQQINVFGDKTYRERIRQTLLEGGVVEDWKNEIVSIGGNPSGWVSESAHVVRGELGEVRYFEGMIRDVHSEMQALERLKLIEKAVECSSDTITLYDAQYKPLYHNPAALFTFGRNLDELAQDWDGTLEPGRMETLLEYLETHLTWSGELEIRHREGKMIPCQVRIDTILGEPDVSGKATKLGTLSVATDISLRREVERVKDEFITTVSHELRTPLTSLRGALGLLAGDDFEVPGSAARDLIHIALSNTERLSRRISDILDMGKLESGEIYIGHLSLELGALLEQAALELASVYAGKGVRLALETAKPTQAGEGHKEMRVYGDAERLLQVLIHLLDNAAKASSVGGLVTARLMRRDQSVRLEVVDGGQGVPAEFEAHIFRRFARADTSSTRENGGLGLGLAISRAIVERHGGLIGYLRLEPGREQGGSVFFVELPLAGEARALLEGVQEGTPLENLADLL